MAIAHQSTAGQTFSLSEGGSTSITVTGVVVDAGDDRCLTVRIGGEGDGSATQCEVTGITRNGQALTRIARAERSDWSWAEIWRLVAPTVGTSNLVISLSESDNIYGRVDGYQGVDQTTPARTGATGTGSGTTATATVAAAATGDHIIDVVSVDGSGKTLNVGANQTLDYADVGLSGCDSSGSRQAGADGGVMTWTWTGASPWSIVAAALIPAAGGGATEHEASASLTATSSITVANREFFSVLERSASLAATSSIAAAYERDHHRAASLSATSSITAAGEFWTTHERAASLTATSAVTAAAHERDHARQASLTATSSVTASGEIEGGAQTHERSASLAATATVTAANYEFYSVLERSASLSATSTVTVADRVVTHIRSASLNATTSITATGEVDGIISRSASLNATSTITAANRVVVHIRQATLAATATVTAGHQRELNRAASLTAASSITAAGFIGEQQDHPISITYAEPARHATHQEAAGITHTENAAITARA